MTRRPTRTVRIGPLEIGSRHPVLIQSMTVADTMDTDAVVAEVRGLVEAGCPLVRLTAPSVRDAENLREIRRRLEAAGIRVPMVADIHFTPNAALVAAGIVEKVRINPGNYADKKRFAVREYTAAAYTEDLERVAERFRPLVRRLKENGAALRIGVNHGSLSDRIMNRYGDTAEGMVESALEFVRICEAEGYRDIVLSMKSAIAGVMVEAYRLLARRMDALGMDYPLHLGVTEAGGGLEGRIKSAAGIGALLIEGIGDTIRVSLTEDARHEIPAARALLEAVERESAETAADPRTPATIQESSSRRPTRPWMLGGLGIGGDFPVRVELRMPALAQLREPTPGPSLEPELLSLSLAPTGPELFALSGPGGPAADGGAGGHEALQSRLPEAARGRPILLEAVFAGAGEIHRIEAALPEVQGLSLTPAPEILAGPIPEDRVRLMARLLRRRGLPVRWRIPAFVQNPGAVAREISALCRGEGLEAVGFAAGPGTAWVRRTREIAAACDAGEVLFLEVPARGPDPALLAGSVLLDHIGDALCLREAADADGSAGPAPGWPDGAEPVREDPVGSAYAILQACRLRFTRAEFIACPSCGRTQFDLQAVTARIRARTGHLTGVRIAIMGCVVNGLGEMADADFGYMGSGPGRVDLYAGRERVRAGVPEGEAADRLIELIRESGRWVDPAC